jgi:hypothetical protein
LCWICDGKEREVRVALLWLAESSEEMSVPRRNFAGRGVLDIAFSRRVSRLKEGVMRTV